MTFNFLFRLSLARAAYANRDVILLDDPLSAVDTRVGKHIFEQCICGLLRNKTRVLVTHQVQYLPLVNQILLLDKHGQLSGLGSYKELVSSGILKLSDFHHDEDDEIDDGNKKIKQADDILTNRRESDGMLFRAEERQKGIVKWSTYGKYWSARKHLSPLLLLLFVFSITEALAVCQDWFLSKWVQLVPASQDERRNVAIFCSLVIAFSIFTIVRGLMFFNSAIQSSQRLHDSMFSAVVKTSIYFFDANPVGRILNRFSKDIGLIDDSLPLAYFDFLQVGWM